MVKNKRKTHSLTYWMGVLLFTELLLWESRKKYLHWQVNEENFPLFFFLLSSPCERFYLQVTSTAQTKSLTARCAKTSLISFTLRWVSSTESPFLFFPPFRFFFFSSLQKHTFRISERFNFVCVDVSVHVSNPLDTQFPGWERQPQGISARGRVTGGRGNIKCSPVDLKRKNLSGQSLWRWSSSTRHSERDSFDIRLGRGKK